MSSLPYKGKIAFVTGGGRGIGLAITRALAEAGATVAITWTSKDPSEAARKIEADTGSKIHVYHCPGEVSANVNAVVERVSSDVGEVDYVIANAGICQWVDTIDMTDDTLKAILETNFYGPVYLSRAFVRQWLGLSTDVPETAPPRPEKRNLDKKILLISSISGIVNMTPQVQMAYNASKAAVTSATKSLAGEWARYGITINSLSPGYVATDMTMHPSKENAHFVDKWKDMTPVDRFADPSEIANMVVLLGSDKASSFMTGHDIVMDGGYTTY